MVQKKIVKKQKSKPATQRPKYLMIFAIILAASAILWAGWWLVFKYNAYTPDKSAVEKNARHLMDSISLKGKEVYSAFNDAGCESNSVGLSTYTNCSFQGYKYVKSSDLLSANFKDADSQIIAAGWNRTFTPQNEHDLDSVLSEQNNQTISYLNPYGLRGMNASLGYYQDSIHGSDSEIKKLITSGKINPPASGEYIYGVHIGASYWGCNHDSFFKICPLPPGPLKNN